MTISSDDVSQQGLHELVLMAYYSDYEPVSTKGLTLRFNFHLCKVAVDTQEWLIEDIEVPQATEDEARETKVVRKIEMPEF